MLDLKVVDGREPDPFLDTLEYRGSGGEQVQLRCTPGDERTRKWFWRHAGGQWHGPFRRVDEDVVLPGEETPDAPVGTRTYTDMGKNEALLAAAHAMGRSGAAMDWRPLHGGERSVFRS